ncbi:hypothetical protein CJP46_31130 [Paenibacillus sp. XY044]|nr:hypothetical protein CJP46_31130 [Paenibacillus sp. XY044]
MKKIAGILLLSICIATGCESHKPSAGTASPDGTDTATTVNVTDGDNGNHPADATPQASTRDDGSQQSPEGHVGTVEAENQGRLQSSQLMFGYLDSAGSRILAADPEGTQQTPREPFTQAVIAPGELTEIRFAKHQTRTEQDTGRQTRYNFANDEGDMYLLPSPVTPADPDDGVVLAHKDAFAGHQFLQVEHAEGSLPQEAAARIEQAKGLNIQSQGLIGQIAPDVQLGIVRYAQGSGNPLASLVLITPDQLLFRDFEGTDDPNSTWRVDDGGQMDPQLFHVLFVTRSGPGYTLGYEWWGAEGSNLAVLQQDGGEFRVVQEGGRYTAPM